MLQLLNFSFGNIFVSFNQDIIILCVYCHSFGCLSNGESFLKFCQTVYAVNEISASTLIALGGSTVCPLQLFFCFSYLSDEPLVSIGVDDN